MNSLLANEQRTNEFAGKESRDLFSMPSAQRLLLCNDSVNTFKQYNGASCAGHDSGNIQSVSRSVLKEDK
jgi:hypothetical protein